MVTCGNQIALTKAAVFVRRRVVEPCSLSLLTNYAGTDLPVGCQLLAV